MLIFDAYHEVSFKYLTNTTLCHMQKLIRMMGRVIGWKKCILLIDALIAHLYDMFLDRARIYEVNHDKSHGDWISSKCGIMLTVNEVSLSSTKMYVSESVFDAITYSLII
jgi:hypothetical protein